jgi:hypothetical protein
MEHQAYWETLILVALVLGIGNSVYIARYLIRMGVMGTSFFKIMRKPKEEGDESENKKD